MLLRLSFIVLLVAARVASADPFADGLKEHTGTWTSVHVLTKLSTFKVGKKCLAKLPDKNNGALHAASYFTRDVAEYAKALTGEDWYAAEGDGAPTRDANKDKVGAMVDAFKSKFSVTVNVEGDDCDAKQNSLWLRAWSGVATSIKNFPPPTGKVFVTINVTSKSRDITVDVKDNTTFTFTMPKDIEPAGNWNDKLDKPFRKAAGGIPEDHVFNLKEYTGRYSSAWVLSKLTNLKLGKKCLAKIADKDSGFSHAASFYTRDVMEYVKAVGGDDWDRIEQQSAGDPKSNRELVAKSIAEFKKRFTVNVSVEGDDCDPKSGAYWLKYWTQIGTSLKNYPPKANKVTITMTITPKAKALTITGGNGTWTITAPKDAEGPGWTDKIDEAFKKAKR